MEIKRITAGCWKGWGRGEIVQGFVERHVQVNGTGTYRDELTNDCTRRYTSDEPL